MNEYNPKNDKRALGTKLHRHLWLLVNATLFRWSPFFCYGWRRFLLRMFGAKIARTATVSRTAVINAPWNLTMGDRSMICHHAWVMCHAPVVIGNQSLVGEYARILTGSHISYSKIYRSITSPVVIGENCWVATCAIICWGGYRKFTMGDGAILGVGAVAMRSIKPMTINVGNPAKYIADREFTKE